MNEETSKKPVPAAEQNDDFNRTVVITNPVHHAVGRDSTPLHSIASRFVRKSQELEDIVGGNNISSRYTREKPDTSAELSAPLSNLDIRYSVLEAFAEGGNATVSIARDRNLRRIVAIKSLKKEIGSGSTAKAFVSEAKVTAQLDHPSIIPVYGLTGDDKQGIHMSMKLVSGKTLRDYLRNTMLNYRIKGIRKFDEAALMRKRLEIFLRVCDAIEYAHHRNIMHRDLKPENIMIGEYMEVYVMDWGLAREIPKEDDSVDSTEKLTGTPRYFPPEALRGERCDARADLFTLGLILQEIVTLQFAIKGKDEKEYMERILNGELEPIEHRFHWRIDKPLKAIIRKATAYRVADRYQTVAELSEDLRRYMGGLSISACPDTVFMKLSRFTYRYRKEALALGMLLLFGFTAVSAYAIHRQLQLAREMGIQRRAMNFAYNKMGVAANHLDITALHIQEQLSALSRISAYLLSCNTHPAEGGKPAFRPTMSEIGKTEPGMFYSPYYKRMVSLDYGIYTLAPDADAAQSNDFMRRVSPVLTKMKNIVLGSKSGYTFAPKDYERLKTDYLYHGFPIRAVYIGSESGLKLLYPWRGNYPRDVDPRKRSWYQDAKHQSGAVWGKPYMDFDSISGLRIPCSVPIYDLQGHFRGAAGLDLSINKLTESLLGKGNTGDYVQEKAVISLDGETVFSSRSQYFNKKFDPAKYHQKAEFEMPLFGTPEIRDRILKQHKDYGMFLINRKGQKILYSFAYLTVFKMYYVVVCDYAKLEKYVETHSAQ